MYYYQWLRTSGTPMVICEGCASIHAKELGKGNPELSRFTRSEVSQVERETRVECEQCLTTIKRKASEDPLFDM